jgi:hypothetical protein
MYKRIFLERLFGAVGIGYHVRVVSSGRSVGQFATAYSAGISFALDIWIWLLAIYSANRIA